MERSILAGMVAGMCVLGLQLTTHNASAAEQELWFVSDIIAPSTNGGLACSSSQTAATATAKFVKNNKQSGSVLLTSEANNCYDYEGAYKDHFIPKWFDVAGFTNAKWMAVPGNHDYMDANGKFDGEAKYFRRYASWYNYYTTGPWIIVPIDSEVTGDAMTNQISYLSGLLYIARYSGSPCQVVLAHRPAYGNASKHSGAGERLNSDLVTMLNNNGVELLLAGHEHVYEHVAAQGADGTMVQVISGTGGARMDGVDNRGNPKSYTWGTSFKDVYRQSEKNGVVRLLLRSDGTYRVEFYRTGDNGDKLGTPAEGFDGTCLG